MNPLSRLINFGRAFAATATALTLLSSGPEVLAQAAATAPTGSLVWTRHAISLPESIWSVDDLKSVDLDVDGRLDLILAGRETRNAVWYRNQKNRGLVVSSPPLSRRAFRHPSGMC